MSRKSKLYREYDEEGQLIKLECSNCGEIKTVDNFYKRNSNKSKDGVNPKCKKCICEKQRKYQSEHKEERAEYNRKYYKDNIEILHEYCRQYRENNKEKLRENNKKYYEENKEEIMKQHTEYRYRNSDKVKKWHKNYREKYKDELLEKGRLYQNNNREKVRESNRKYYHENLEKECERKHKSYEKISKQEMERIYDNFTKNNYPNNDIQYGIIYGVHCKGSDRWYIGQTIRSFNLRYNGNFFKNKFCCLSDENKKGQLLHDDIEKYGQENFEIFEVLDVAFSEKELDEKEAYYIDYYKAYDEGYNSNRGNIFKHNKSKRKEVI